MDLFPEFVRQQTGYNVTPEHRFHPERKWRIDYAIVDKKIAIEQEGGAFTHGRHTRGAGFVADMEKYNELTRMGWRVIRVTPDDLLSAKTLDLIKDLINAK